MQLLCIRLDKLNLGIALQDVQEVVPMVRMVPIGAPFPPFVEGVLVVRGDPVVVIDLRALLGRGRCDRVPSDHLVIVRTEWRTVALHVDRVEDLIEIDPEKIRASRLIQPGLRWITGISVINGEIIYIQDIEAYLERDERTAIEEALAATIEEDSK